MAGIEKISASIDPHGLEDLDVKAYWALDQMEEEGKDRFSSTAVSKHLIEIGISTSRQAVEYVLKKNKKRAHKNTAGYKLMEDGRAVLKTHVMSEGVIYLDTSKPYSAKYHTIKGILGDAYGEVNICDPYLDQKTLDVIFVNLRKGVPIRILTQAVNDKPSGTLKRQLAELIKEGFNVEVRVYGSSTLHDRYIMTDQHFWLSGTSLNSLGQKESFLVLLGEDIRQSMTATFNSRWKSSTTF